MSDTQPRKNMIAMGKVDTSDLMMIITWVIDISFQSPIPKWPVEHKNRADIAKFGSMPTEFGSPWHNYTAKLPLWTRLCCYRGEISKMVTLRRVRHCLFPKRLQNWAFWAELDTVIVSYYVEVGNGKINLNINKLNRTLEELERNPLDNTALMLGICSNRCHKSATFPLCLQGSCMTDASQMELLISWKYYAKVKEILSWGSYDDNTSISLCVP